MLVEGFLQVVLGIVGGLVELLPEASDLGLTGTLGTFFGYAKGFDSFVPVSELVVVLGAWLAVQVGILAYGVLRTIWGWIPFV